MNFGKDHEASKADSPGGQTSGPKAIAIDYGEARIGVAGTDALGLLAHPLETVSSVPRPEALRRLAEIVRERQADLVVIGLPVRADGEEGTAAARVRRFAETVGGVLPAGVRIEFQDEFLTTKKAAEHLRAAGRRAKDHRPVIDQAAATVILQEYLDSRTPVAPVFPEDLQDMQED